MAVADETDLDAIALGDAIGLGIDIDRDRLCGFTQWLWTAITYEHVTRE